MRILISLFIPFFIFAEILKYENIKPYYYPNELVNFNIRVILPTPKKINVTTSYNVETNLTQINPYIYLLNVKFLANNEPHKLIIISKKFYKEINLNNLIKIKKIIPPKNYSNIVADDLKIENPIATKYDKNHTILNFNILCKNCFIKNFKVSSYEQNLTTISQNKASYYVILPKNIKEFTFFYFNSNKQTFEKIKIPVIITQNIISTQTNINPEDEKIFTPLNILILILIAFSLIIFLVYQKIFILLLPILLSISLLLKILPKGEIEIKKGTKVQILPTKQSTIIYISNKNEKAQILNKTKNYIKIKINNKIGWIKSENYK
ncbi:hypothetical protein FE773_04735 [Caminibacter mediatlanticus TB-2]|uniref:SH3 domain-containing protein n=2 Tax=Caminibacter mediatlanticus TaxID=291048 RepID=A0ABX5VC63_9BACT|nr:hypothetical protein [Caminibacter mediatlanticus]QCT94506.1 hypothetical protein FE773_04735 [Caminibacter mediatlanticus TB-2]